MSKQPEQVLEDKLLLQLQTLGYTYATIHDERDLLANLKTQLEKHNVDAIESSDVGTETKNSASNFDICTNCSTFASTVHTALPIRTASQGVSFAFTIFENTITTSLSSPYGVS